MRLLTDECDPKTLSTGALSFLGDSVYSLLVRERLSCDANRQAGALHSMCKDMVKAEGQAKAFLKIEPMLTEEETAVYKRGRNHNVNNIPKGATIGQYHSATGVEALFGYLYLSGRTERIRELFDRIWEA